MNGGLSDFNLCFSSTVIPQGSRKRRGR